MYGNTDISSGCSSTFTTMSSPPAAVPVLDAPKPERPSAGVRMPSLNQLAARINLNGAQSNNASSALRPRLAASLLRTGSQTSLASSTTAASASDSVAVNAPTTRSTSPAALSTSPPRSNTSTPLGSEKGEQLTQDNLEHLNEEVEKEKERKKERAPAGYKNIPSLDAITARLAKARQLSVDGTAKPPEAETIEDPKTPGLRIKAPEHPLEHTW